MTPFSHLPLAAGAAPDYLGGLVALVVGAAAVAYFGFRVRLVPIVGFLITGVVIGPSALGLVNDIDVVRAAAEVGVLLLLFTIGLEFSLGRLNEIRRDIFLGGGLQVALATAAVTAGLLVLDVDAGAAIFTGLLVSLSSTAIVFKLLSDRGETNSAHGRLSVAVLLFQDLAIVAMVLAVPALGEGQGSTGAMALALLKAVGVIAVVLVLARRTLPPVLERVARTCSPEIFLLTIVAICFGTAYLSALAGLSVSLGAFLAGLVVSESRFQSQALGEILPLQIIFSAVFFVSVGMLVDLGFVAEHLLVLLGVVAAVLVVKAVTTTAAGLALGRPLPVAAAAGLLLAQVGEFSFVLSRVGEDAGLTPAGQGDDGVQGLISATVLLMALTPSLSAVGDRMARRLTRERARPALAGRDEPLPGAGIAAEFEGHVVIAGYGQNARGITAALQRAGVPQVITTLSPDGASEAHARSLPVLLGDPARIGTLQEAGVMRARAVVIPDDEPDDAARIVGVARALRDDIDIVVRTRYAADIPALTAAGASSVIAEEIEASASLSAELLHDYGVLDPQAREQLAELRRTHYPGPAPPAPLVQLRRSRVVDTDHLVEVVLRDGCEHVDEIRPVVPSAPGCEECLRDGDSWVELRLCLTCGHVGCCDSSPNRHARHHSEHTAHHMIRSAQPGESWVYCLADELLLAEESDPLRAHDARH